MKKIGLLSDTHGSIDERIFDFFQSCDEVWHAGDIGNYETLEKLNQKFEVRAVYGNIDGDDIRRSCKEFLFFKIEDVNILITHIGGYPSHYDFKAFSKIKELKPNLFVCGHSHILKVMFDKTHNMLVMNPGAYGNSGFHKVRTAIRFEIEGCNFKNLDVLEIDRK